MAKEEEDEEHGASIWKAFFQIEIYYINTLYRPNLPITWFGLSRSSFSVNDFPFDQLTENLSVSTELSRLKQDPLYVSFNLLGEVVVALWGSRKIQHNVNCRWMLHLFVYPDIYMGYLFILSKRTNRDPALLQETYRLRLNHKGYCLNLLSYSPPGGSLLIELLSE